MKPTTSVVATVLLLSAPAAWAGPIATTTDEARAMAGRALPSAEAVTAVVQAGPATTTDEARAIAGRHLPPSSQVVLPGTGIATSTDEARAMAGGAIRAPAQEKGTEKAVACPRPGACKQG
ncbi:MAG: hypothetical protein NDI82_03520 [Anaeromyxobacteraceae bacterium]|nr:hypothetical protein [Anaeromyxobacteraceae bacterium]